MARRRAAAGVLALVVWAAPAAALPPLSVPAPPDSQVLKLDADRLRLDRESATVAAEGDVRLRYGRFRLRAQEVLYDRETGAVVARGDVRLAEPGGTVVSGERIALSGDFKDAVVQRFGLAFGDGSRLAAAQGRRLGGRITRMRDVAFSPCRECGPGDDPLWSLEAERVVHDREARTIAYRDVRFTVAGTPIAYFPFLRHPDPTVVRRAGFLAPGLRVASGVGVLARSYYYQPFSPSRDVTWETGLSSRHGPLLGARYRQRLAAGELSLAGSVTRTGRPPAGTALSSGALRGHVAAHGRFHLNRHWRWGFRGRLTRDRDYLADYGYAGGDLLVNRVQAERFTARRYRRVRAIAWQDRRERRAQSQAIPVLVPDASLAGLAPVPGLGGSMRWRANLRHLDRGGDGRQVSRLALKLDWTGRRIVGPGLVVRGRGAVTAAAYRAQGPTTPARGTGSFQPIAGLDARYPLARRAGWGRLELAPRAAAIAAPRLADPRIPREDTSPPELDTINLFALDRAPGFDRTEAGYRAVYGLRLAGERAAGGRAAAFVGRSHALDGTAPFARAGGLDEPVSDLVGRASLGAGPLSASYRVRADPRTATLPRQEATLRLAQGGRELAVDYLSLAELGPFARREELQVSAATPVAGAWQLTASHRQRFDPPRGPERTALSLGYRCDCLQASLELARAQEGPRRERTRYSASIRLGLKTLGGVGG